MILTYNIRHGRDFSVESKKARQIAKFAMRTKSNSSKDVKHIGLPSAISNQILRKYRKKGIKNISTVKLTIPGQSIRFSTDSKIAKISCLDLALDCRHIPSFEKIRQIEIGQEFAHVSVQMRDPDTIHTGRFIGVDCNTTGHAVVAAVPHTGKAFKLGKTALYIHHKYKNIRKKLQKQGKYHLLRQIRHREKNIIRDLNHKISKKLVQIAVSERSGIRFEKLSGIRKNPRHRKNFQYSINSWSYYQLQKFTEYKARMCGIEVAYVAPAYTSQSCSICGSLGDRDKKKFSCPRCGHVDHADVNAAFNIGSPVSHCAIVPLTCTKTHSMNQLHKERDLCKGSTDTPHAALPKMLATVELQTL
jgi:putative transposase